MSYLCERGERERCRLRRGLRDRDRFLAGERDRRFPGDRERDFLRRAGDLERDFLRETGDLERDFLRKTGDLERDFLRETGDLERDFLREIGDLERDFLRETGDLERDFLCETGDLERDFLRETGDLEGDILRAGLRDLDSCLERKKHHNADSSMTQSTNTSMLIFTYPGEEDLFLFLDVGEGEAERRDFATGESERDDRRRFLAEGEYFLTLSGESVFSFFSLSVSFRSYLASVVGEGERLLRPP